MIKRIICALLLGLPLLAAAQSERPSWRSSEDTPARPELPPEVDKPDFQFEVDREALFAMPGMGPKEDGADQEMAPTEPELGRVATWRERTFGGLGESEPAANDGGESGATIDPEPAPEVQPVPEVQPSSQQVAAVAAAEPAPLDPEPTPPPAPAASAGAFHLTPIARVSPEYPRKAYLDGQEGWVDLRLTVAPDGSVADVQVVDAEPRRVFERAAIRAAMDWRFQAPASAGLASDQTGVFRFEFNMDG